MKFSIVRSNFLDGLLKVQNVVTSKGTLQILHNALLEVEDGRLCITTTDLDISERCYVDCDMERPGATTLPIRRLASIVRELDEGRIVVDVDEDDVATLQKDAAYFKIIGMSAGNFPPIGAPEGMACYKLNQGVLREMLRKTSYAVSEDETRQVLNGVLFAFKDSKLTMVATDGRRLALVEHEVDIPPENENEMILPTKAVNELMRMIGDDEDIKIYPQKNQIVFASDNIMFSSKLREGIYPNYRQVLPGACDERVAIDREALLAALRRVSMVSTDKSNAIRMTFSANQLTLSINTPDVGEARDTVPVKYAGKEIAIIFNPEYVMDPLRNMDEDEIYFELNDGNSPALMKCSVPFLYVLMPLRIS